MLQTNLLKSSSRLIFRSVGRNQPLRRFSTKDEKTESNFLQELYGKNEKVENKNATSENVLAPNNPERLYRKVHVAEIARKPLLPGVFCAVLLEKNEKAIKEIVELKKQGAQAYLGVFMKKAEGEAIDPTDPAGHLYEYGTFAQVHTIVAMDTPDSAQLLLLGHRRIRRVSTVSSPQLEVNIEHLKDEPYKMDDALKATNMEIVSTLRELLQLNVLYGEQFRTLLSLTGSIDLHDISRLTDVAANLTSADDSVLQTKVLQQLNVTQRARDVLLLLKKEIELCRLQADIREQVESKIQREQRRLLLMEQLKSIKKELGLEKDDKSALIQRFNEKWSQRSVTAPEEVCRTVSAELEKLSGLETSSPEFNVTRTYLEWLTSLPWGITTPEKFDLDHAKQVLDSDHYGLEDVKERIFEFVAVGQLKGGKGQGKILCLVGPPGVGKTSIGKSIAAALNRKYFRFSVGGLSDVAEIKGHRRTYVGAMPGKVVQCLKSTQSSNPFILIDEIDKLGRGHSGDPASALLELLDPEQNSGFLDHYLDLPLDLSNALFVCTANQLDSIPGPLLDRMEVIRLSGYAADEKRAIARRYLEPAAAAEAGVPTVRGGMEIEGKKEEEKEKEKEKEETGKKGYHYTWKGEDRGNGRGDGSKNNGVYARVHDDHVALDVPKNPLIYDLLFSRHCDSKPCIRVVDEGRRSQGVHAAGSRNEVEADPTDDLDRETDRAGAGSPDSESEAEFEGASSSSSSSSASDFASESESESESPLGFAVWACRTITSLLTNPSPPPSPSSSSTAPSPPPSFSLEVKGLAGSEIGSGWILEVSVAPSAVSGSPAASLFWQRLRVLLPFEEEEEPSLLQCGWEQEGRSQAWRLMEEDLGWSDTKGKGGKETDFGSGSENEGMPEGAFNQGISPQLQSLERIVRKWVAVVRAVEREVE